MRVLAAIVFFLAICAVSALLFLESIPALVHRTAPELDRTALILAGLMLLAIAWWFASGRNWLFAAAGWVVLAIPFAAHAIWQGEVLLAERKGAALPGQMAIENYRETPIFWDGFDGPVGLTVEFDLVHPPGLDGIVFTPQVRMAPVYDIAPDDLQSTRTFGGGYFKDHHIAEQVGDLVLLKPVVFQDLYDNTPPDLDVDYFAAAGRTRMIYRLHPGATERLEGTGRICLANPSLGLPVCGGGEDAANGCVGKNTRKISDVTYNIGTDLTALWTASGGTYRDADLSGLLTAVLRQRSSLQGDSAAWTQIQKRFEPAGLAAAGYGKCPAGPQSHSIGQVCYCRF